MDRGMKNKEKCTCFSLDIWLILDDSIINPYSKRTLFIQGNYSLCLIGAEGALNFLQYQESRSWCPNIYRR